MLKCGRRKIGRLAQLGCSLASLEAPPFNGDVVRGGKADADCDDHA
jgi:hypothetical protein